MAGGQGTQLNLGGLKRPGERNGTAAVGPGSRSRADHNRRLRRLVDPCLRAPVRRKELDHALIKHDA
jgi:hypothetical protein